MLQFSRAVLPRRAVYLPHASFASKKKVIGLPDHMRAKELAKVLRKCSLSTVIKGLCIQHAKKIHMKFEGEWYRFGSAKEVVIPFQLAADYAMLRDKNFDPQLTTMLDPDLLAMHIPDEEAGQHRKHVVVLLGHYNHGKTTLLDALGSTSHVTGEAHGITQDIRLQTVNLAPGTDKAAPQATMVDTPGQNIFFRMRNYGATVADMVVLVVAVDAGIDEQTAESIGIAQGLDIPIVCCINKIDTITDEDERATRVVQLGEELRQYEGLEGAAVVGVAAVDGTGLDELRAALLDTAASAEEKGQEEKGCSGGNGNGNGKGRKGDKDKGNGRGKAMAEPVWYRSRPGPGGAGAVPVAMGVVANAWSSPGDGHSLLIVVRSGQVKRGDAYASGGWAGTVRSLLPDGVRTQRVESAGRGDGVTALVSIAFAGEPRPLGEPIFFFKSKKEALRYAEQWNMAEVIKNFRMGTEDFRTIRYLEEVHSAGSKVGVSTRRAKGENLEQDYDDGALEIDVEENAESSFDCKDNDDDDDDWGDADYVPTNVVLKADSEMAIGTLIDSISATALEYVSAKGQEEEEEEKEADEEDGEERQGPAEAVQLVRTGVGNVRLSDVRVAEAAAADIYMYRVQMDPRALRRARELGLRMLHFDKLEDVLESLQKHRPS
jgi:small GTP-binding protein